VNDFDPHTARMLIEFLERKHTELYTQLKADMLRENAETRKEIKALAQRQQLHDRMGYMAYGAALVAWSAIEIGIKLLNV
jgi:hypothetical protein